MDSKASVLWGDISELVKQVFSVAYPVGSIYITLDSSNPANRFGGSWQLIDDNTFIASKGLKTVGNIGGSNNAPVVQHTHPNLTHTSTGYFHALKRDNSAPGPNGTVFKDAGETGNVDASSGIGYVHIVQHKYNLALNTHTISNPSGSVPATNANMPRYLACYIWRRIA